MPEPTPERTALYRLYDADGTLLYVGITHEPLTRWKKHARERAWWADVVRMNLEWFESRKSAMRVEKAEIEAERPVHNVHHNGGDRVEPTPAEPYMGSVIALHLAPRAVASRVLSTHYYD